MFAMSSLLFVPGSRPDRFAKARVSGADCTIIDLEDAVADGDKATARDAAVAQVMIDCGAGWGIRINAVTTAHGLADLLAVRAASARPAILLIPMVESPVEVDIVARVLDDPMVALIPLIETARGLANAAAIGNMPGVAAMMFGGGDLSGDLGVALAWEPMAHARGQFILACSAARVGAIDVPWLALDDGGGLTDECIRSKAIGFGAKAAIHPTQVAAINRVFRPSAEEVADAHAAIAAYDAGGRRAIRHQGRMLEAPIIKRYAAIIAKAATATGD